LPLFVFIEDLLFQIVSMKYGNCIFLALVAFAFLEGNAQTTGDYQSAGAVDLNAAANWQTWNGSAWVTATIEPDGNILSGNTVTILPTHQWNNSSASSIPLGATLINQGTTGTFTTSVSNKVVINGTYVHYTTSSVSTILQGMTMSSASNFIYRGSSTLTPAVSFSNRTYYNLSIESVSGSFSVNLAGFSGGTNPLTVNGSFSIGNHVTLNQNTFTGALNINGDVTISGNLNINSFSIASAKSLTLNASGIITIPSGETVTLNGSADLTTGKFSGAGNLVVNGSLKTANANGISTSGSFGNTGTVTLGASSIIEFNGNAAQEVPARTDYTNLTISGAGDKILSGNMAMSGNLSVSGCTLALNNYDIEISGNASGSASGYIKTNGAGSVIMKNITTARNIPVGNSTYNPVTISNGDGLDWSISVMDSISPSPGFSNASKAILRTWKISPSGLPAGATIVFQYDDSDPLQKANSFLTNESVQVWNYHSGSWSTASLALNPTGSLSGGTRTVTLNNQANFSPFSIANISTPLGIRLNSFKSIVGNEHVELKFVNDTEYDIANYFLEKVEDGQFKTVASLPPLKNDGGKVEYEFVDRVMRYRTATYRIKALERNGDLIYSNIIRVDLSACNGIIIVMNRRILNWQALDLPPGKYQVGVSNLQGQLIYREKFVHSGGNAFGIVQVNLHGIYILKIDGPVKLSRIFVQD
jgi:hypothetical protein